VKVLANRRILIVLGLLGVGSHNALGFPRAQLHHRDNGVILNSFIPVMIIAISWIFLHQRLSGLQIAGRESSRGAWRARHPVAGKHRAPARVPASTSAISLSWGSIMIWATLHGLPALASRHICIR
jgi:hypothetical protein